MSGSDAAAAFDAGGRRRERLRRRGFHVLGASPACPVHVSEVVAVDARDERLFVHGVRRERLMMRSVHRRRHGAAGDRRRHPRCLWLSVGPSASSTTIDAILGVARASCGSRRPAAKRSSRCARLTSWRTL